MKIDIEFSGTWSVSEEEVEWLRELVKEETGSNDDDSVLAYLSAHPSVLLEDSDYSPDVSVIVDNLTVGTILA